MGRPTSFSWGIIAGFVIWGAGCGGSSDPWVAKRPKVVLAEGTVKYSGDPLAGATVVFNPATEAGTAAQAVTDASGHFQLMAFPPEKGAVPGQYKVTVTKIEIPPTPKPPPGTEAGHEEQPTPPPKHLIPERYSDPEKSGLSQDIPPEGKKDITITIN